MLRTEVHATVSRFTICCILASQGGKCLHSRYFAHKGKVSKSTGYPKKGSELLLHCHPTPSTPTSSGCQNFTGHTCRWSSAASALPCRTVYCSAVLLDVVAPMPVPQHLLPSAQWQCLARTMLKLDGHQVPSHCCAMVIARTRCCHNECAGSHRDFHLSQNSSSLAPHSRQDRHPCLTSTSLDILRHHNCQHRLPLATDPPNLPQPPTRAAHYDHTHADLT